MDRVNDQRFLKENQSNVVTFCPSVYLEELFLFVNFALKKYK